MSILEGLLGQSIDSICSITTDGYGDTTQTIVYSDVPCRWQNITERIVNSINEEVTATIKIWLLPVYSDVLYSYQIVQNSKTYNIQLIKSVYDLDGNLDHIKMFLL